jgi:UDPglucose 6-dehydrogenase
LITALQDMGATIRAYDPVGMDEARKFLPDVKFTKGPYACAEGADAIVIVTEWEQFRSLDFRHLKRIMTRPVLVDLRNVYRPEEVAQHGFVYASVGRPVVDTSTPTTTVAPPEDLTPPTWVQPKPPRNRRSLSLAAPIGKTH